MNNTISAQNKIAEITIEGNKKLKTRFVKEIISLRVSQTIDSTKIEQDADFLVLLPAVAKASYQIIMLPDSNYHVVFKLEENITILPNAKIYTTTQNQFAFSVSLHEFNFFGNSTMIGGFYQHDIRNSFGVQFKSPYLFNRKMGLAANVQQIHLREPLFFETTTVNYNYSLLSYELLGLQQLHRQYRIEYGINYFTESFNYHSGVTNDETPGNFIVSKMAYKLNYEFAKLKYDYYLLSGIKNTLHAQRIVAFNQKIAPFLIAQNDFIFYKKYGAKSNWATRFQLGFAQNSSSAFAPFLVDNNLNIRGVGNKVARNTASLVLNSEYRQTIFQKKWFVIQSTIFIDVGTFRTPGGNFNDFSTQQNIHVFSGAGLRLIHQKIYNAILRFDLAKGLTNPNNQWGWVIGIGQFF